MNCSGSRHGRLKQFCQRVPEAASVEKEIEELAKVAFKEWDENKRKEIQHSSYMSSYSQTDKRARGSQDWKDLFKE